MGTSPALTAQFGITWRPVRTGEPRPWAYLPCELCGTSSAEVRSHLTDTLTQRRDATYVRCRRCSLTYQNPRPATYGQIRTLTLPGSMLTSPQGLGRVFRTWLAGAKGLTVLVLGCGDGQILRRLAQAGWKAVGIERGFPKESRSRDFCVLPGPVESCKLAAESLDGAIAADSLPVLPNPAAALQEIHFALKPRGKLLVTVPNADAAAFAWFGWDWPAVAPGTSLFCFNLQTLTVLLEENGFRPISVHQAADGPSWLWALRRRLKQSGWVGLARFASNANPLARLAAWAAARVAATLRRGDRVVILAEKR